MISNRFQHTRWLRRTQRKIPLAPVKADAQAGQPGRHVSGIARSWTLTLVFLLAMAVTLFSGPAALAQQDYPGGYTLMPLNPGPIQLLSMTLDASVRDDGEQAWVDTQAVYRVHNRDLGQPQKLTLALPGYAVDEPLPDGIALKAGRKDITYGAAQTQWWLADVILEPDERLNLVLTYSAPLGSQPFVTFRFPLKLMADNWPGALESARVTLTFEQPPNPQSWLTLTPEDYKLTAEGITWSFDAKDPSADLNYEFMRPALWSQLHEARRATTSEQAGVAEYLALGDIYVDLATNTGDPALFERYFPLAVATYSRAQEFAPDNPDAYLALANLYRARAEQTDPDDSVYISLAANELAGALTHGANDPAIAEQAAQDYALLLARARLEGQFDTARAYLDQIDEFAAQNAQLAENPILAEERQRLAIDWATTVLRDRGPAPARAVLAEGFGDAVNAPPGGRFTRLNSLHVQTDTKPGRREFEIIASAREDDTALVDELFAALQLAGAAEVTREGSEPSAIRVAFDFADSADLQARLAALSAAIPPEPEWALLRSILRPRPIEWLSDDEGWRKLARYNESVNLLPVLTTLGEEAQALEAATGTLDPDDPLDALIGEVWKAEAEVWRRFSDNNRAYYTLTMYPSPGAPVVRNWSLDTGEQVQMGGQSTQYNLIPYVLAALGIYLVLMLISLWLWRR
ncbi:MAG: hypothetical protein J5I90_02140 [Caldilineales bacterium]|nr:hypothetical protein [Caldilineales bacterium]